MCVFVSVCVCVCVCACIHLVSVFVSQGGSNKVPQAGWEGSVLNLPLWLGDGRLLYISHSIVPLFGSVSVSKFPLFIRTPVILDKGHLPLT